jgi:hypothetical protein
MKFQTAFRLGLLVAAMLLLVACGTLATPPAAPATATPAAQGDAVNPPPTIAPSATPLPPTATPTTPAPTEVPTEVPSATPEEVQQQPTVPNDPIVLQVQIGGNPTRGQTLFETVIGDLGYACATCHAIEGDTVLIGPSLAGIGETASTRVDGEVAERYIFHSIIEPQAYIVAGFEEPEKNIMPEDYRSRFTDQEIFDIIAYLLTLE